ncbi:MAG: type II toxin-antitoxin system HicB family antitoxin [Tannerella sp.]|jgi:predicted HicB family RNase H-like nuclease|nr:type II toxin-antitoxin system HicB family antitoxin [Tannerella sp.]
MNDKLEYKGYYGSIEYSKEDHCLYGKVLGMPNNLISYEGATADELFSDFKDAVDTYLDYCQSNGIKPKKSYNGVLNIRIPAEIHSKIAVLSDIKGVSINAFIRDSIERRLAVED